MAKKSAKVIRLFANQGYEEDPIELLQKYEPGPVYILSTDTPDGPGVYLCDEPFTLEEAEAQNNLVPDDLLEPEDVSDVPHLSDEELDD